MRIVAIAPLSSLALPLALLVSACAGHTPAATDPPASTRNAASDGTASAGDSGAPGASEGASANAASASPSDATSDAGVVAAKDDAGAAPVDSPPVNTGPTFDMSVVESVLK